MAIRQTIYGPQFWTDGTFSSSAANYQSTEAGGSDLPVPGYPEIWGMIDVTTQASTGPAGETSLVVAPNETFLSSAGIALIPGRNPDPAIPGVPSYQFDTRGDGQGIVIEWYQKYRNSAEVSLPNLLVLVNGSQSGAGNGLFASNSFLEFTANVTSLPTIQYFLEYQKVNGTGTAALSESVSGGTDTLDDAWHLMQVVLKPSTVNGAFAGGGSLSGGTVLADGSIHIYKDATSGTPHSGTRLFAVENAQLTINEFSDTNPGCYYAKALWHGYASLMGSVTGTWIYYVKPEQTKRNLLTGLQHWVSGMDNLQAGRYSHHTGDRSVVFALDNAPHTTEGSGKFWLFGEFILNGTTITGSGGAPTNGTYVTLTTNGTLTDERVLTGSGRISVTDNGAGSTVVLDVPNDAITYAKIQNVSATSRVLGRASSGAGDIEELPLGAGLQLDGTTLRADAGEWSILTDGTDIVFDSNGDVISVFTP